MQIGEQFDLTDDEVLEVKYLRTLQTKPKKNVDKNGNPVESVPYAQMRLGNISFTANTEEDVAILSSSEGRDDIYSMTLEVTEFQEEDIDNNGNPVLDENDQPVMKTRRGLAFVSLLTYTSKQAREMKKVSLQGAVHAEKKKFGLIEDTANVDDVATKLFALMQKKVAPEAELAEA